MQVPQYSRGLALRREVANTVDLGAIDRATDPFRSVSKTADTATQIGLRIKETQDMTAVNSAVIRRQKEDLDFQEASRKENESNPIGFAKRVEPEYKKRDEQIVASLPSNAAKEAYKASAERLNLRNYEQDLQWENKRSTEMFANQADQAIKDLEVMAFRGASLEELKKNRQATAMTLGSVLAPDQIAKFDQQAEERITQMYLEGAIDRDPYAAKKLLESKEYDSALGADKLSSLYNKADSEIDKTEREALAAKTKYQKMFTEDPAALAELGGVSPDNYQGKIDYQREKGVAEGNISIIPKQTASIMANQLQGAKNSDQFLQQISQIAETVGSDNYNLAMKDLKKAGLSDQFTLMAMMNPEQDKRLMDATFAMAKDSEIITKKATAQPDVTTAKLEEAVSNRLSDTLNVLASENPGGEAQVAAMQKSMVGIATYFASQGNSLDESARMGTDWMNSKVAVAEINGKQFRVPELATPNEMESALEEAIYKTKFSDTEFEDNFIKRTARPVLHPDETKYYLLNDIGLPVEDKKGVVYYDVKNIIESRKSRIKDVQTKAAQDSYDLGD